MSQAKAQWIKANLKKGEVYAGLLLGKNGEPDQHIILLPGDTKGNFNVAQDWAKNIGGELPARREQSLLFANCPEEFQKTWYWSGESYSADPAYAWFQHFDYGYQDDGRKLHECRARAVRRLIL